MWAELKKMQVSSCDTAVRSGCHCLNKWLKEMNINVRQRQKYCWTQSVSREVLSSHLAIGYLLPVRLKNKPTCWGKAGVRRRERKMHIITVYIILEQKKRGKRVYFHIKKGMSHLGTHSTEWMKIAYKLIKLPSSHSRDVFLYE